TPPAYRGYIWMVGLHMAQFGGSLIRLLYGVLGLAGCMMLVAGNTVWLRKRAARQTPGLHLVQALNTAVFFGLPVASLVLLWANRAALVSSRQPLARARALLGVMAALALGLPLVNFLAAPYSHLLVTFGTAPELALVDLTLLICGVLLAVAVARYRPRQPVP